MVPGRQLHNGNIEQEKLDHSQMPQCTGIGEKERGVAISDKRRSAEYGGSDVGSGFSTNSDVQ
jgi:hypothetical protein